MKKFLAVAFLLFSCSLVKAQAYQVTLHTPNFKSGLAYLTYYYGANINIEDSALINDKGIAVFKNNKTIQPGIYSIIFPGKAKLVDFFISEEPVTYINADTTDLVNKTVIKGSKENVLFQQYQKYISVKGKQLQQAQQAYSSAKTKADSVLYQSKYEALNNELNAYRENMIKQYPESMLAAMFKSMKSASVPIAKPVTREDSITNYNYYKKHYWDGITFMDGRIIRTPFFLPKLEKYFREVIVPAPDSIIKEADYLLLLARSDTNMYRFLLNWLTDEYIYPKYMGQDAVFVHLFDKYHSKGVSTWLNQKQLKTISDRAYMLMANLIGEKAADLNLTDTSGKISSLYSVNAAYTVVCFWDPTCGHCREEIPKLDSIYKAKWKQQGIKIYGVLTEKEKDKWLEFIHQHNLKDWVHVYQTEESKKTELAGNQAGFRQLYDVTQTPTLYLLDKDKRIIAKKLTLQQIDDMLQVKIKNKQVTQ